jgi:bifunctional DNase/RNase
VALALRVGAPILVNDELMAAEGRVMSLDDDDADGDEDLEEAEGRSEADLVAELRDFLDTIRPEDFNQ